MRWSVLALALLAVCVGAARVAPNILQEAHESFIQAPFTGAEGNFGAFWRGVVGAHRHKGGMEMVDAYVSIRFTVPPSEAESFEEAWLDLESRAYKNEDGLQILALSKTKTDNLFYVAYGEWEKMRDLAEHIESHHFEDFAKFVDKHGIRWQLQLLENMSEDVEEEQGIRVGGKLTEAVKRRHKEEEDEEDWEKNIPEEYRKYIPKRYRKKGRREEKIRVLFTYFVNPSTRMDFESDWKDAAYKTIKEDGNTAYTLRKVKGDNTRYYGYGTWDSYEDLREHIQSGHTSKLRSRIDGNDIVVFMTPLMRVEEGKRKD